MPIMRGLALSLLIGVCCQGSAFGQFGAMLTGVGPINRSMGGAATAAPLDTLGAFQWNPATISAMSQMTDFGLELLVPHSSLSSTVNANSLGAGTPPVTLSGTNHSNSGVFPLPEFGITYRPEGSPLTYGLGVLTVGGFGVNYPGSTQNPLLTPPPPNGLGVGPIFSQYQLMQIVPTLALQLTDALSLGVSPIVDSAGLSVDPGFLASPDGSGGGYPTFPSLNHGQYTWGAGFQLGAFYVTEQFWQFGASFKSQQWFQDFSYNAKNQAGVSQNIQIPVNAPMVISVGTAYTGIERILLALDARYLDYKNTVGFAQSGFTPSGAIAGLGWNNIFALSSGVQYQPTDFTALRMGYSFSTNPISGDKAFYNIASPLVIQHGIYFGGSYNLSPSFKVSLTYAHFFSNSVSGPIMSQLGAIPGTNVTSTASADSVTAGATITF